MSPLSKTTRRLGLVLAIMALIAAAFAGGIIFMAHYKSPAAVSLSGSFSDADRLRYRAALEKLRYELKAVPGAPPFEQSMTMEEMETGVAEDTRKARLLKEKCGIEVDETLLREEFERVKADPGDTRVLAAIVGALDNDPAAVIEFFMRPTLVDRYLRACVSADDRLNAAAVARIAELRAAAMPETRALKLNLQDAGLDAEDREALAATPAGQRSATVESETDFHFFVVQARSGDTIEAGLASAAKPRFEEWLKSQP